MNIPTEPSDKHKPCLADLLTEAQEAQLALLLAELMRHGRGTIEIEVWEGRVTYFNPKPKMKAETLLTD